MTYKINFYGGTQKMTSQEKAKITREKNLQARMDLWQAQKEATHAARSALTKLMEREDATPAEIIQASQLLVELGRH